MASSGVPTFNTERIHHLYQDPHIHGVRLFLHYGDIADSTNLIKLVYRIQPDEIYHLGAQSHVRVSFEIPEYTGDVTGLSTVRILQAIRETGLKAKFYQAVALRCMAKRKRFRSVKRLRSTRVVLTGSQGLFLLADR